MQHVEIYVPVGKVSPDVLQTFENAIFKFAGEVTATSIRARGLWRAPTGIVAEELKIYRMLTERPTELVELLAQIAPSDLFVMVSPSFSMLLPNWEETKQPWILLPAWDEAEQPWSAGFVDSVIDRSSIERREDEGREKAGQWLRQAGAIIEQEVRYVTEEESNPHRKPETTGTPIEMEEVVPGIYVRKTPFPEVTPEFIEHYSQLYQLREDEQQIIWKWYEEEQEAKASLEREQHRPWWKVW